LLTSHSRTGPKWSATFSAARKHLYLPEESFFRIFHFKIHDYDYTNGLDAQGRKGRCKNDRASQSGLGRTAGTCAGGGQRGLTGGRNLLSDRFVWIPWG